MRTWGRRILWRLLRILASFLLRYGHSREVLVVEEERVVADARLQVLRLRVLRLRGAFYTFFARLDGRHHGTSWHVLRSSRNPIFCCANVVGKREQEFLALNETGDLFRWSRHLRASEPLACVAPYIGAGCCARRGEDLPPSFSPHDFTLLTGVPLAPLLELVVFPFSPAYLLLLPVSTLLWALLVRPSSPRTFFFLTADTLRRRISRCVLGRNALLDLSPGGDGHAGLQCASPVFLSHPC